MKKLLVLFCLFIVSGVNAQDLPNFMTEQEKLMMGKYQYPFIITDDNNPPPGPVRTMAEWEQLSAIQITWTAQTTILRQIVDYAQEECLVYIICSDSNTVKTNLQNNGVPLTNVKFLITGYNSIWCRDYGPWSIYSNVMDTLRIVDWIYNRPRPLDDVTPLFISNYTGVPIHRTLQSPNDLVNTGGNFMVDGHGTAFASKLILSENAPGNPYGVSAKTEAQIDGIMNSYMGINRYIKMETLPYDVIHHIDMHIKLLDEETLLVGQYPPGVADGPQIEANLQYVLNNFQTCFGRPYKVIRIPMPPENGQYPNTGGDYRTYTNSVFVNKTVIVPTYELQYDTTALRIYREALPGYNIVGINCNSIIPSLGAIHCITKEIGVQEPVFISHAKLLNTDNTSTPYQVKAYIKTKSGVANAKVFWRTDTTMAYNQVNMSGVGDTFTASIPPQSLGTSVYYYVSATSVNGKTVTKPLPAPAGYIRFEVDDATSITGNNGTVNGFNLSQNYPNPFNPTTEINFTIPKSGFVELKVYDLTGRLIKTLVSDTKNAGSYNVEFNAEGISSGVYFYKLSTDNFSDVKRMIILK